MKKAILILVFPILMLTGCGFFVKNPQPVPVLDVTTKSLQVNPELLKPCALLAKTRVTTIEEILLENITLYGLYATCARKQLDSATILQSLRAPP